jgi:hypothetical protein
MECAKEQGHEAATGNVYRQGDLQRSGDLNYLLQVNAAGGGHFDRYVLKSIVYRSGADLVHEIS